MMKQFYWYIGILFMLFILGCGMWNHFAEEPQGAEDTEIRSRSGTGIETPRYFPSLIFKGYSSPPTGAENWHFYLDDGSNTASGEPGFRIYTGSWIDENASGGGGGAPTDATYLTQTENGTLTNEQAFANLSSGLLKVTTGTGVVETATAGSDYIATETDPTALLTAGTDNVKDTHIDWGTGASQVSGVDLPDEDVGDVTITSGVWAVEDDSHDHTTTISGKSANVSDADFGDVTVASGAWAVEDDSHAHTGTTLSGIDISDDTNLAAGTNITLSDDTLNVDDAFVTNAGGDTMAPKLTISDSATTAPLNVTERNAAPSSPASGDVYLDDGSNTGSGNPGWRRYTGAAWEDVTAAAGGGGISIGDSVSGGTSGSVLFIDASTQLAQDNAAFFWLAASDYLGLSTTGPDRRLDILHSGAPQLRLTTNDGVMYTDIESLTSGELVIYPKGEAAGINSFPNTISGLTSHSFVASSAGGTLGVIVAYRERKLVGSGTGFGSALQDAGLNPVYYSYFNGSIETNTTGAHNGILELQTASSGTLTTKIKITGSTGYVGINTSGADRRLDILDTSAPQLRLTHTDGSVYAELQATSNGELYITGSGTNVGIGVSDPDTVLDVNGAITLRELSVDPSDPDEGSMAIWMSDGTGSGDDGDVMVKITAGGSTKTITLIDFSAF